MFTTTKYGTREETICECGAVHGRGNSAGKQAARKILRATFGNKCIWCWRECETTGRYRWERDRIIPGGRYTAENTVSSCGMCNNARRYLTLAEAIARSPQPEDTWSAILLRTGGRAPSAHLDRFSPLP